MTRLTVLALALVLSLLSAAAPARRQDRPDGTVPAVVAVPAGRFIRGSDGAEREAAYRLDEQAYGQRVTREQGWYDAEAARAVASTGAYAITQNLITNRQYAAFVAATRRRAPGVTPERWRAFGLQHSFEETRRFAWRHGRPPPGRAEHPVVLVSWHDAQAYAAWLSRVTGARWRLPTEIEWEKAARGVDGRRFPWGDGFDAHRLNSADAGPSDTVPVGSYAAGASPYGMLDAAGQVFEWTADHTSDARVIVKGGSWDDQGCGVCRPAARSSRPATLLHVLIGIRLLREPAPTRAAP